MTPRAYSITPLLAPPLSTRERDLFTNGHEELPAGSPAKLPANLHAKLQADLPPPKKTARQVDHVGRLEMRHPYGGKRTRSPFSQANKKARVPARRDTSWKL
jgi:hypothetical protein